MTTYALCIGIDEYEKPLSRLRCARKDADDLARVLREALGFEAQSLKPPAGRDKLSTEDVFDALDAIGAGLSVGDSFVLSFSGHGAVEGDEQYFFLSGARRHLVRAGKVAGPGVLAWSALREHTAQEQWSGVQRIFILDACREPLLPSKRLAEPAAARFDGRVLLARNLVPGRKQDRLQAQKPDEPPHTLLHACSDEQLAFELPDGHNSVFTAALMQTLKQRAGKPWRIDKDYLDELRQCVDAIRAQAGLDAKDFAQAPAWNATQAWLVPADAAPGGAERRATATSASAGPGATELDARLWRVACAKNTVASYEDYMRHAPPGALHADEAGDRIEELLAREQGEARWPPTAQPDGLDEQLDGLRQRLQAAVDRVHDDKLIQRARRMGLSADYDTYLAESRLRERVAEAEAAKAAAASDETETDDDDNDDEAEATAAGVQSIVTPNRALAAIVGDGPLPRMEVTSRLWAHIKTHNLQDPNDKRTIVTDAVLARVCDGRKRVSMFDLTRFVTKNLVAGPRAAAGSQTSASDKAVSTESQEGAGATSAAKHLERTLASRPSIVAVCLGLAAVYWLGLIVSAASLLFLTEGVFSAIGGLLGATLFWGMPLLTCATSWRGVQNSAKAFALLQVLSGGFTALISLTILTAPSSNVLSAIAVMSVSVCFLPLLLWHPMAKKWFADVAAARRMAKWEASRQKAAESG